LTEKVFELIVLKNDFSLFTIIAIHHAEIRPNLFLFSSQSGSLWERAAWVSKKSADGRKKGGIFASFAERIVSRSDRNQSTMG